MEARLSGATFNPLRSMTRSATRRRPSRLVEASDVDIRCSLQDSVRGAKPKPFPGRGRASVDPRSGPDRPPGKAGPRAQQAPSLCNSLSANFIIGNSALSSETPTFGVFKTPCVAPPRAAGIPFGPRGVHPPAQALPEIARLDSKEFVRLAALQISPPSSTVRAFRALATFVSEGSGRKNTRPRSLMFPPLGPPFLGRTGPFFLRSAPTNKQSLPCPRKSR